MYVAFLGTGNALPSIDRANTALALVADRDASVLLVDCGGDPYRELLRVGLTAARISDIIITHAHIDHIGGLPSLIESFRIAGRTAPLRIHAIPHAMGIIHDLMRVYAFELTLDQWPFTIEFNTLTLGTTIAAGAFNVKPMPTEHSVPSMGMRIVAAADAEGPIFAYTCDTVFTTKLHDIARDATLFIAEATYLRGHEDAARVVYHMTAQQAAQIATASNARALALVHLSLSHADEAASRREARSAFRGNVIIPHDGVIYAVERRGVRRVRRLP